MLWLLASQAGQVVTKATLLDAVWVDTVVSEGVLTACLRTLRQALGEDAKQPRYLATVHRLGYRFIAPVTPGAPATSPGTLPSPLSSSSLLRSPAPPPLLVGRAAEVAKLHTGFAQVQ